MFLITPQTSEARIRFIDSVSNGFIYMVSSAATTGNTANFGTTQTDYFKRINRMQLNTPQIVGFGIKDHDSYTQATTNSKGAIIGSAFITFLNEFGIEKIDTFIGTIRP